VRIQRLSGGNTNQLGVIEVTVGQSQPRCGQQTSKGRSLTPRSGPIYSGGIAVVAKAFEMAMDRARVKKIAAYLKRIGYTYPYHQAIGFYLERAGYKDSTWSYCAAFRWSLTSI